MFHPVEDATADPVPNNAALRALPCNTCWRSGFVDCTFGHQPEVPFQILAARFELMVVIMAGSPSLSPGSPIDLGDTARMAPGSTPVRATHGGLGGQYHGRRLRAGGAVDGGGPDRSGVVLPVRRGAGEPEDLTGLGAQGVPTATLPRTLIDATHHLMIEHVRQVHAPLSMIPLDNVRVVFRCVSCSHPNVVLPRRRECPRCGYSLALAWKNDQTVTFRLTPNTVALR